MNEDCVEPVGLARVKDVVSKIGSGKTPSGGAESYLKEGVLFIRSQNIHYGGIRLNDVVCISEKTHREMWGTRLKEDDVLLNITGASLGRVARVPAEMGEANVNQHVCILRPTAAVDPRFLEYSLSSHATVGQIRSLQVGGNREGLNFEQVGNLRIPVPSIRVQNRVANFLDLETGRLDRLINAQQSLLERLAERRMAGIVAAVSGYWHKNRRSSTLAWLDTIPDSWLEVRLGLLARMGSGHTPSRSRPEWWIDCSIPWITTGEVKQVRDDRVEELYETREKISELGLKNSAAELHPAGTVVLCRTASAGYSAIMGTAMATSQDFVTWTSGPRLNPYYLLWCLRAMRPDLLGRLAMGSTHKTIYVPDLQMLRIPLPPLDEQQMIVDHIRSRNALIDRLVDAVRRQIALLVERRQALITMAVTGQFDVSTTSGRGVKV